MVDDTEPRYRLVDSGGTVVGSLHAEADGTLRLQEGTSGNDNEASLQTDGTWDVPAVSTEEAQSSSDTLIEAERDGDSSSTSSGTWKNLVDSTVEDNRGEFTNQTFSPDKDGYYDITGYVVFDSPSDGDALQAAVLDSGDNIVRGLLLEREATGSSRQGYLISGHFNLSSTETYSVAARNNTNSFVIGGGATTGSVLTITWQVPQLGN